MTVTWERIKEYRSDFTVEEHTAFLNSKRDREHWHVPQNFRAYVFEDPMGAIMAGARENARTLKQEIKGWWTWVACKLDDEGKNIVEVDRSVYSDRDPTEFVRVSQYYPMASKEEAAASAKVLVERNGGPHYLVEVVYDFPPKEVVERLRGDFIHGGMNTQELLKRIKYMRSLTDKANQPVRGNYGQHCVMVTHDWAERERKQTSLWAQLEQVMEEIEAENEKRRG